MLLACCLYITTTHLPKEGEGEDRTALQPCRHFCSPLLPLCPATPLTPGASLPQTASAQVARSSETPGMNIRGARNGTECLSKRSWGSFQALDSSNQKLFFSTMDETHFRGASCTQRPLQPTATIQEVAYFFTSVTSVRSFFTMSSGKVWDHHWNQTLSGSSNHLVLHHS